MGSSTFVINFVSIHTYFPSSMAVSLSALSSLMMQSLRTSLMKKSGAFFTFLESASRLSWNLHLIFASLGKESLTLLTWHSFFWNHRVTVTLLECFGGTVNFACISLVDEEPITCRKIHSFNNEARFCKTLGTFAKLLQNNNSSSVMH